MGITGMSLIYKGKEYTTLAQITNEYDLNYDAVYAGLKKGKTLDAAMETTLLGKQRKAKNKLDVVYNGVKYENITYLSRATKIPAGKLKRGLNKGMSVDEIVKNSKFDFRKVLEYNNKKYVNLTQLAEKENVRYSGVYNKLQNGLNLEDSVNLTKEKSREIEYKGKKYKNLKELSQDIGIPHRALLKRRKKYLTMNDSIDGYKKQYSHRCRKVTYRGKEYESIKMLAENVDIQYVTLTARIRKGMSIEEAVDKPVRKLERRTEKS